MTILLVDTVESCRDAICLKHFCVEAALTTQTFVLYDCWRSPGSLDSGGNMVPKSVHCYEKLLFMRIVGLDLNSYLCLPN